MKDVHVFRETCSKTRIVSVLSFLLSRESLIRIQRLYYKKAPLYIAFSVQYIAFSVHKGISATALILSLHPHPLLI